MCGDYQKPKFISSVAQFRQGIYRGYVCRRYKIYPKAVEMKSIQTETSAWTGRAWRLGLDGKSPFFYGGTNGSSLHDGLTGLTGPASSWCVHERSPLSDGGSWNPHIDIISERRPSSLSSTYLDRLAPTEFIRPPMSQLKPSTAPKWVADLQSPPAAKSKHPGIPDPPGFPSQAVASTSKVRP